MDVKERLLELTKARGWTLYRLSKESGVAWSTVRNMFERNTMPTLPTVEALCKSLGATMSELFYDEDAAKLSDEERSLLTQWGSLCEDDRGIMLSLIKSLNRKQ